MFKTHAVNTQLPVTLLKCCKIRPNPSRRSKIHAHLELRFKLSADKLSSFSR